MKSNQPTFSAEIKAYCVSAPADVLDTTTDWDRGRGRIEERQVTVSRDAAWLGGDRRLPGELRFASVTIIKVLFRTELKDRCRTDIRLYISSANFTAQAARGHRDALPDKRGTQHAAFDVG